MKKSISVSSRIQKEGQIGKDPQEKIRRLRMVTLALRISYSKDKQRKCPHAICLADVLVVGHLWSSELLNHWIGSSLILSIILVYWAIMNGFVLLHAVCPTSRTSLCMEEVA